MNKSRAVLLGLIAGTLLAGVAMGAPSAFSTHRPHRVAMITWRGETDAERGFVGGLAALGADVSITRYPANQDLKRLAQVIAAIRQTPVDLIYVFGTRATQTVLQGITDIPVVFNIVTQPVAAGVIQSWAHSGNNAVGASNQVPVEKQLKALKKVVPFRRLGIIYNPGEPNSTIQRDMAARLQEPMAFTLVDFKIAVARQLQTALERLKGDVDAVFIPADSLMISLGHDLADRINTLKIPSLVTEASMVQDHGMLLGLMPSYYELGLLAAQKASRILLGESPTEIPSSHLEFFQITVNMRTARAIGVQIPMSILGIANKIVR